MVHFSLDSLLGCKGVVGKGVCSLGKESFQVGMWQVQLSQVSSQSPPVGWVSPSVLKTVVAWREKLHEVSVKTRAWKCVSKLRIEEFSHSGLETKGSSIFQNV